MHQEHSLSQSNPLISKDVAKYSELPTRQLTKAGIEQLHTVLKVANAPEDQMKTAKKVLFFDSDRQKHLFPLVRDKDIGIEP